MLKKEPSGMREPSTHRAQASSAVAHSPSKPAVAPARVRSSSFKYYIHDSTDALRLKLIGDFTEADVTDLNGCWRTARTTLANRKLILDLHALISIDEAAKRWLAAMSAEGACYTPEDFLLTCVAGQHSPSPDTAPKQRPAGLLSRLASLLRGPRVSSTVSPTREP